MAQIEGTQSVAFRILRSRLVRLALFGCLIFMIISVLWSIPKLLRGDMPLLEIGRHLVTSLFLSFGLLAGSSREGIRRSLRKGWVAPILWGFIITFALIFVRSPAKYWWLVFIGLLMIYQYLNRFLHPQR